MALRGGNPQVAENREGSATTNLGFADPYMPDAAVRLRAAAAAGRAEEIEDLLTLGIPVDAPDADGETALMKGIEADRPAIVRLLRRHGANLELKNLGGRSARDLATAASDPALHQAIASTP